MGNKLINPFFSAILCCGIDVLKLLNENYMRMQEVFIVPEFYDDEVDHHFELKLLRKKKSDIYFKNIHKAIGYQQHLLEHFQNKGNINAISHIESKQHSLSRLHFFLTFCKNCAIDKLVDIKEKIHRDKYFTSSDEILTRDLSELRMFVNHFWLDPFHEVSISIIPIINQAKTEADTFNYQKVLSLIDEILLTLSQTEKFTQK